MVWFEMHTWFSIGEFGKGKFSNVQSVAKPSSGHVVHVMFHFLGASQRDISKHEKERNVLKVKGAIAQFYIPGALNGRQELS
jgi:hypothetical protein